MYTSEYVAPTLTVDGVVFQMIGDELAVLLLQRASEPFAGEWALPGGYNPAGETTRQALDRILLKKTGIDTGQLGYTEQLYTFDTVARDPRGHAVSVTYLGLSRNVKPHITKDTQNPQFFPVNKLPKLAYDHDKIIALARERLQSKVGYTNVVFALLPKLFTLTQLQKAYDAILGKALDKRNFRKKYLSFDLLTETDELAKDGAHRPARLYKFRKSGLQNLIRDF